MSRLQEITDLARLTGRMNEPRLRKQLRRLAMHPDPTLEQMLIRKLSVEAGDELFDPRPFRTPRAEDLIVPDAEDLPHISVGHVCRLGGNGVELAGVEFEEPLSSGHVAIFGGTRMGKTRAALNMLGSLPERVRCLIVDPENDPAIAHFALQDERFRIIDWPQLLIGIFHPPTGVPREVWFGQVTRNLRESKYLGDGTISMLNAVLALCQKDRPDAPIGIRHVYNKLIDIRYRLSKGGREANWWETLRNRLEGLMSSRVFDCVVGHDTDQLTARKLLIRARGMPSDDFVFMLNDILSRLSCVYQPDLNPEPRLIVMIDELHRVTNAQRLKRSDVSEPIVTDAVRALAKCRINMWLLDQNPSQLPPEIVSNCATKMIFALGDARELDAVQRSLGLDYEQRKALARLPKQTCVVHYMNPNFAEPFLVRIPNNDIEPPSGDAIAERVRRSLEDLNSVPSQEPVVVQSEKKSQLSLTLVSDAAQRYLAEIAKDQLVPVSKRDEKLGLGLSTGNNLRNELEAAGLIKVDSVKTHGPSRTVRIAGIEDKGYQLLKTNGVPFAKRKGKGGLAHQYHQGKILEWAERNGYEARIEFSPSDKSVDVALLKHGKRIAVEIVCHGIEKELWNLADIRSGFDEIWFAVAIKKIAEKLQRLIETRMGDESARILDRVAFKLLSEFQQTAD